MEEKLVSGSADAEAARKREEELMRAQIELEERKAEQERIQRQLLGVYVCLSVRLHEDSCRQIHTYIHTYITFPAHEDSCWVGISVSMHIFMQMHRYYVKSLVKT
jgi:hypothetical protein